MKYYEYNMSDNNDYNEEIKVLPVELLPNVVRSNGGTPFSLSDEEIKKLKQVRDFEAMFNNIEVIPDDPQKGL